MRTEKEMLAALAGGAIIKAFPDTHPKPWIDFRGNAWTNAEIEQMKKMGIADTVPTVSMTKAGWEKLPRIGEMK